MIILQEFKADMKLTLQKFANSYICFDDMSPERQKNLAILYDFILEAQDAVELRKNVDNYIHKMSHPLMLILPIFESGRLYSLVKEALAFPKYQEIAMLKRIIKEKDDLLLTTKEGKGQQKNIDFSEKIQELEKKWAFQEQLTKDMMREIQLMQRENAFLYQTIITLNRQNQQLKEENEELKITSNEKEKRSIISSYKIDSQ